VSLSVLAALLFWFTNIYTVVPVKYEQVVFCGLSDFQLSLYRLFIQSPDIRALLRGANSQPLKAINILKKLCNHPELLDLPNDLQGSEKLIPEGFCGAGSSTRDRGRNQTVRCDWGGKFLVLERFVVPPTFPLPFMLIV
jgi:DNA repair and recombination RAD54-like protein